MKKNIILLLIFTGLLASCDIQMDDVFDRNAAERVNALVEETYDVLTSAPNGWIMEFYPQEDQNYGGVNILMRFDENDGVVMINETATDLTKTEKSTYTINRSSGAVLAFDTYNSYITYYADPYVTLGEGRSKGFMGDLEFAVKSVSESEIVLAGTKTQNRIVMKALPQNVTWEEYMGDVQRIRTEIRRSFFTRYEAAIGGRTEIMSIDPTYPKLSMTYQDANGNNRTVVVSYMHTSTGIKLYEPFEIFGETMQNFVWNPEESSLICTDPGANASLHGKRSAYFRPYDYYLGTWKFYSYNASGTLNPVYTVEVTEDVQDESFKVSGITYTGYGATIDLPFRMNWSTDGRVSIIGRQYDLGTVPSIRVSSVTYENVAVHLYACTATTYYRTTYDGAGMISKTDLVDDRVDFENNGIAPSATGFSLYYNYLRDGITDTYLSSGGRWLLSMYMVRE